MTIEQLKELPKIELHCHLDGSLSKDFIQKRIRRKVSEEDIRISEDCGSLSQYLEKFRLPGLCLMDEEGLEGAGFDVMETMSRENVCYAEIRFAPLLSTTKDMGAEDAIAALLNGLKRGKEQFHIEYGLIICAMRQHSEEDNYQMIRTARKFLGKGVCAADLAGAEASYPMAGFMELFRKIKRLEMPFTIHAGECGNARNITDAVQAGAKRIGHGIAMRSRPEIQRLVKDAGVGIEMCPSSNFQTKAVAHINQYPLREFLDAGLLVSINTDNRTVSDTSMTKELKFIQDTYGINDTEISRLMKNAVETSFADKRIKDGLMRKLEGTFILADRR